MNVLSFVCNTLASGAVYALFALAVVLVYRSSRVLLFCIGEIGMIAAYTLLHTWAWLAGEAGGLPTASTPLWQGFALGLLAALLASAAVGFVLYLCLGRLDRIASPFVGTAVTIAFSIALLGLMTTLWQGEIARLPLPDRSFRVGGQSASTLAVAVAVLGGILVAACLALLRGSRVGIEMQALASDRRLALLRGVPVQRRLLTVWLGSAALSGLAGTASATLSAVSIDGAAVGFSGIVAAILGGLTSPGGALVGALLLAVGENLTSLYFDARYSVAVPVLALLAMLALRPSGLSARVEHIVRT
ncbi:branched-chain amino acid ABC transporter permease [Chitinasiproducens palmae]|uniref:Amino acid/amide ABC transporter membrane protein 1, HAAT family n=1 Tax=Chitinasiproducens palmae TaxID=1770053 RepID=A0A1H2PS27_9BURK|nr:branched-chain amino acid ABC transporter permease [Chitinasiproducens palmae]SDV48946.1 amino acid/amide ABC transporter membrane protein 1, HAAT family [Chitinasiproducens palmae]